MAEKAFETTLFDDDRPEQAAEYLRLTLGLLNKAEVSATPVNYDLFYTYVAGKNRLLNEKLDIFLAGEKEWNNEEAKKLFNRFFYQHADVLIDDIREDLLRTVAQVLGSLLDIAGKTSLSNNQLLQHIDKLAAAKSPNEILSSVSTILGETRSFVTQSKRLEKELIVSSQEVDNLKAELVNARNEATTDVLTGLHNRRGFDQELQCFINDRRGDIPMFSIIMADLDRFKKINDAHGHLIGDKVLGAFADVIRQNTRSDDYLARYGGEEFVMILPNSSVGNAQAIAEAIRKAFSQLRLKHVSTGKSIGNLSVSLGVTEFRPNDTHESLLERCDKALYQSKMNGRNQVTVDRIC